MFLRFLFLALALAFSSGAHADSTPSFGPLAREANSLAANLSLRAPLPPAPEDSRQALLKAAEIMQETQGCSTAVELLERAMLMGEPQASPLWQRLAKAAACANRWDLASQAAYNARKDYAPDDPALLVPLTLMATALENRRDWRQSWTRHALTAYQAALAWARSLDLQAEAGLLERRVAALSEVLDSETALLVEDVEVATADGVSICLRFNDAMPATDTLNYGDYIRFSPTFEANFAGRYHGVCAQGATPGTTYQVTVRKGLKGASKVLREDARLQAQVDNRPVELHFSTSAYVLAQHEVPKVPLRSVNAKSLDLKLIRVHPGNLSDGFVRNNFRSDLSYYQLETLSNEVGEEVWSEKRTFDDPPNQTVLHEIALAPSQVAEPGLYVLFATDAAAEYEWNRATATQWLVVTDIGLSSYRGQDGLTVVARSLSSAELLAGMEVSLYARNNQVLDTQRSDADGTVRFPAGLLRGSGGREAVTLVSRHPAHGFALLDITAPAFDLSDRNTGGRKQPGPLDLYVYTDRGAYRPGETVHAAALLRDAKGGAGPAALPLSLVLEDSDGDTMDEQVLQPVTSGAYSVDLRLPDSARTGRWRLALRAEADADPIGETRFLVEALLPPRMEADLSTPATALTAGLPTDLTLNARYLFGAPGADLAVQMDMEIEPDPEPFPEHKAFRFGRVQDVETRSRHVLQESRTGEDGKVTLPLVVEPDWLNTGLYQRARIRAEVLDVDGRSVPASAVLSIRNRMVSLGIRPDFDTQALAAQSEAPFQLLALNPQGQALAQQSIDWKLLEEKHEYQWYQNENGAWAYHVSVRERPIALGRIHTDAQGGFALRLPVDSGDYRLDVSAGKPELGSSLRFSAGSGGQGGSTRPDGMRLKADKDRYLPGDQARIRLQTPFAGTGTLAIASDRIHQIIPFLAEGDSTEVSVDVGNDWGPGAYALVSLFRPGQDDPAGAKRAVGVTWLAMDDQTHRLDLALEAPEESLPRQPLAITAKVKGTVSGEKVFLTIAAVDEGVLQLTRYQSPDPQAWFFGKRQLGVGLRDAYGSLIRPAEDNQRFGAGASGRRGMPEQNIAITALYSGPVIVDDGGSATIELTVPDFTGRLRLMAVAATRERGGAAQGEVRIAEPVTTQVSKPRFLALGDRSQITLTMHNLSGPEGDYRIEAVGDHVLTASVQAELEAFQRGQRRVIAIPVEANALGLGKINLNMSGPEGYEGQQMVPIGVRGGRLPETRRRFLQLAAGESFQPPATLTADMDADSLSLQASVQSQINLDVPGVLKQLDLYPYGCLEQTVSRALPLLYQPELAKRWNLPETHQWRTRLEQAVNKLLEKQREDGSFGLWSDHDRAEPWLSAYATEFLVRARQLGIRVPRFAYEPAIAWLAQQTAESPDGDAERLAAQSYAHYVLALAGEARPEDARYLLDTHGEQLPSALAAAQLGATFALLGDRDRAGRGFELALQAQRPKHLYTDYGSRLRDLAAAASLMQEHGAGVVDPAEALQRLAATLPEHHWLSTQELAWLAMAARGLNVGGTMLLSLDGAEARDYEGELRLDPPTDPDQPWVINGGEAPVWVTVTADGTPMGEAQAQANGLEIRREILHLDGSPVAGELAQGEPLIVLLEGQARTGMEHRALIVDALPAGLEVDNPRLADARGQDAFDWLPELSVTRHIEPLDDRFVAALDLDEEHTTFRVAYLARAVTPGEYALPPVTVEDMYRPQYRGQSDSGKLLISQQ